MRLVVLLLLMSTPAMAEYIVQKSQWDEMDPSSKAFYSAGLMDGFLLMMADQTEGNQYKGDLRKCLIELEMGSVQLAEMIDNQYSTLENWGQSPMSMLVDGSRKVCLEAMNLYRASRGQPPMEP